MKILFLQLWADFFGGAETVNDALVRQFIKDGYESEILCVWKTNKKEDITNIDYKKSFIAEKPDRKSYKEIMKKFKLLKLLSAIKDLIFNLVYYFKKYIHYIKLRKKICSINPDYIIISNIELVKQIPKKYLKKSFLHMHSGYDFYFENENKKLLRTIKKYEKKVFKLVWLTPNFMNLAIKAGLKNSVYMFNPVRFNSEIVSKLDSKKIVFIGRLSRQKRAELLVNIVNKINNGYSLDIYGSGDSSNIIENKKVFLKGTTSDIKKVLLNSAIFALTSYYEGFPMVILEAYECGVPVIAYDFGPSSDECILNGKTGFVIKNDDELEYLTKLKLLCENNTLRKKMGQNAKKFAGQFQPDIVVKKWYKEFKKNEKG